MADTGNGTGPAPSSTSPWSSFSSEGAPNKEENKGDQKQLPPRNDPNEASRKFGASASSVVSEATFEELKDNPESPPVSLNSGLPKTISCDNEAQSVRTTSDVSNLVGGQSMRSSSSEVSQLVDMVREQMDLVKSLTSAQIQSSAELARLQEEKKQLETGSVSSSMYYPGQGSVGQSQYGPGSVAPGQYAPGTVMPGYAPTPPYAAPYAAPYAVAAPPSHPGSVRGGGLRSSSYPPNAYPAAIPLQPYDPRQMSLRQSSPMAAMAMRSKSADIEKGSTAAASVDPRQSGQWDKQSEKEPMQYGYGPGFDGKSMAGSSDRFVDDLVTPNPEPERPKRVEGVSSRTWSSFARFCTFFIPDACIMRDGYEAKQAWREKVAIFLLMILTSVIFVGVGGFVPILLCKETQIFTMKEIWNQHNAAWTVIHGKIYDVKSYIDKHPGGSQAMVDFLGKDASRMFPRKPAGMLPSHCFNIERNVPNTSSCTALSDIDDLVQLPCHNYQGLGDWLDDHERATLAYSFNEIHNDRNTKAVTIHGRIYNVTDYINGITISDENEIDVDQNDAYLSRKLNRMIIHKVGEDATELYDELFPDDKHLQCLDELFFIGLIDDRFSPACRTLNFFMFGGLIFIAAILLTQCICSLVYIARAHRTFTTEDSQVPLMVMVPCYNEGDKELRKTIDSVLETDYPEENKVLLVVADGNITGRGETMSTPDTLANILGFKNNPAKDKSYGYKSIGALTDNRATVHYGHYQKGDKFLKYIVVIKVGTDVEQTSSSRPGNRGKRDSQLILQGFFNRVHHGREMTDLDSAMNRALDDLCLPVDELRYLMAIDADTRIDTASLSHMVYSMNKNDKVLACCGETRVENKAQSLTTFIQVFEYYTNHHMKKAFESVFGCVTCLPGCFTMYRMFSEDGRPLLSSDNVYYEYARNDIRTLHEKNLFHLGEDRMLTTLLLMYFPDMYLSFVPEAVCWTIVPHTFKILRSQRRRWINSTIHNMFVLLKVDTMCGICCFSMKTIVALDLLAVAILPASMLYVIFFLYMTFVMGEPISQMLIILYGIIIGVQLVVFIIRSRFDYLFWFLMFVLFGVPVFYFILPLYAFWHMDDFSWGNTRMVANSAVKTQDLEKEEDDDQDALSKAPSKATRTTDEDDDSSNEKERISDEEQSHVSLTSVGGNNLACGTVELSDDILDKLDKDDTGPSPDDIKKNPDVVKAAAVEVLDDDSEINTNPSIIEDVEEQVKMSASEDAKSSPPVAKDAEATQVDAFAAMKEEATQVDAFAAMNEEAAKMDAFTAMNEEAAKMNAFTAMNEEAAKVSSSTATEEAKEESDDKSGLFSI